MQSLEFKPQYPQKERKEGREGKREEGRKEINITNVKYFFFLKPSSRRITDILERIFNHLFHVS
jgi:hypothetical protein